MSTGLFVLLTSCSGTSSDAVDDADHTSSAESESVVSSVESITGEDMLPAASKANGPVPERTFSMEGPDGALRISFDDLDIEKILNVTDPTPEIVDHLPDWLTGLEGRQVRIRGSMYPSFETTDLTRFGLERGPTTHFGPVKADHYIQISLSDGVTTDYNNSRLFEVEGVFKIRPDVDSGELWQLYQIEDAIIMEE